jgi:hypothetical protein
MPNKFADCIVEALKAAKAPLTGKRLAAAQETYDEAYAAALEALGPEEADRLAAGKVMDALAAEKVRARQLRALAIRNRRGVLADLAAFKRRRGYTDVNDLGAGGKPPEGGWVQGGTPPAGGPHAKGGMAARFLELLVEKKPGVIGGPKASVEGRYLAVRGQFDAMMADLVERFESKTGLGAPGRALLKNVVREAFGEDAGDAAAKMLAQAWTATAERARQMFNAAGGGIAKRDGWGMPQFHDPLEVRRMGKAGWVEFTLPLLAREKMVDRVTGQPFSEKRLRAVLSETYDSIASGGASKREPGEFLGAGMLANQRGEERFLVFKDAASWLRYQDQAGAGDPFGIMMGHLDEMARDIARLQVLGPNPDHQFKWLKAFAQREADLEQAAGVQGAQERARVYLRQAQNMMDHFTGAANVPEREWLANLGATTRAVLTPAALGSAILSDVPSSPVFGAYARAFAGSRLAGDLGELVAHMAAPEARAAARRSGFVVEQATDALVRGARDGLRLMTVGGKVDGRGLNVFARRLPAAVFRLSYLTGWTAARKRTFRLEMMGALADRAGKTLAELAAGDGEDRAFAELFAAHGFTDEDLAKLAAIAPWSPREGARFLRPVDVVAADEDLGLRLAELVEIQTRQAVPETTLWTRAKLLGQDRPGTFFGEFRRSWAMFRSFTYTASHLYLEDMFLRGQASPLAAGGMAAAAAALVGLLTVAGGISIQLREIAKGNDPRDMRSTRFWAAAATQGGGFGIVGDFLYSSQSRAGKSAATTGWGPAAAFLTDVKDVTWGNVEEVASDLDKGDSLGEAIGKAHPGRDALTLLRRYTPVSSIWWARAAWDRAVVDQLQRLADPDADHDFRRRARRYEREFGQGQWWPSGSAVPTRAPDAAGAFGDGR